MKEQAPFHEATSLRWRFITGAGLTVCVAAASALLLLPRYQSGDGQDSPSPLAAPATPGEGSPTRARYEWMRLHNPTTGTIPRSIASREQAFVRSIAKSAGKAHSQVKRGHSPIDAGNRLKVVPESGTRYALYAHLGCRRLRCRQPTLPSPPSVRHVAA
jgi:hypothetical protein